jgi:hypothetical protein
MSAERNDGGPAFPRAQQEDQDANVLVWAEPGMTLRDYFAAKALAGTLADHTIEVFQEGETEEIEAAEKLGQAHHTTHSLAEFCYEMADAMLKARGGAA